MVNVSARLNLRNMEEGNELRAGPELPAFNDIVQRFSLFSASALCNTQIGPRGSLYCNCEGCSQWRAFVEGRTKDCKEVQYEVFTIEHVKKLAHYLLMRAARYKLPQMNVLEVGAGSGRLCHHLNSFLSQACLSSQGCVVQLTAADSGERGLNGPNVAKQDATKAISEGLPHVVLVSWMPFRVDWTAHMRATPSVLEYILIGEIDDGICGDPWLTWGYTGADDSSDSSSEGFTSLGIYNDPAQTKSLSNNGAGIPIHVIQMNTDMIPDQSWDQQESPSVQSPPLRGIGFEDRGEKMSVRGSHDHKRLKLGSESWQTSAMSEALGATKPKTISAVSSTSMDSNHEILQIFPETESTFGSDMPPYAADGWVRTELTSLSLLQICRTDERWSTLQHSHTVSFRRPIPSVSQNKGSCDV